jgi:hypothetical protein
MQGGGQLSQLESTIIPLAQIVLGVVIYVIFILAIFVKNFCYYWQQVPINFGRHLRGFLGVWVGGWGPNRFDNVV